MFRIEKNGVGPYRHVNIFPEQELGPEKWMGKQHLNHQVILPNQDNVLGSIYYLITQASEKFPLDIVYCFNSEVELLNSFSSDELWRLEVLGFIITEYDSSMFYKALHGSSQSVIFKTEESYEFYLSVIENNVYSMMF